MTNVVRWLTRLRPPSLMVACGWIVGTAAGLFVLGSILAVSRHGMVGLVATGSAAAVCGFGSVMALVVTVKSRGPNGALVGLLAGMVFRMALPFVAGLCLSRLSSVLLQAGVFGWIVAFYLPLLMVETVLAVQFLQAGLSDSRSSR